VSSSSIVGCTFLYSFGAKVLAPLALLPSAATPASPLPAALPSACDATSTLFVHVGPCTLLTGGEQVHCGPGVFDFRCPAAKEAVQTGHADTSTMIAHPAPCDGRARDPQHAADEQPRHDAQHVADRAQQQRHLLRSRRLLRGAARDLTQCIKCSQPAQGLTCPPHTACTSHTNSRR
jgi:hypothetical protein